VGPAERVQELVEPILTRLGLELFDVEHKGAILRVCVDRPGGVDLDALSDATRAVSAALDADDPLPGRYTLEVSSPGLERPLRTPAQFRRFVGTTINVKTNPDVEGDRRIVGPLDDVDDEGVTVAGRRLAYGDIERARTVFEWGPTPKPKGAPPRVKAKKKAVR
jgi:ribosome maturation factor RimP